MAGFNEASDELRIADAINRIAFKVDGKSDYLVTLICDLQGSAIQNLSAFDKRQLAQQLNEAIAPVIEQWREKYLDKVRRTIGPSP